MSDPEHFDPPGSPTSEGDFRNQKATELTSLLQEKVLPFVHFVGTLESDSHDIVVFDVEPEVPQYPEYDIRNVERVAVLFDPHDESPPDPRPLRKDFPLTPHQNVRLKGEPRSLCLYEESYQERRHLWTAAVFIRRLHEWLTETAKGQVHNEDQPLERLFLGTPHRIVLPSIFYSTESTDAPSQLSVISRGEVDEGLTLLAVDGNSNQGEEDPQFIGMTYDTDPRTHGLIQFQPQSIAQLAAFLEQENEDFLGVLRSRLRQWWSVENRPLDSQLIIILRVPKRRKENSPVESVGIWAFATKKPISKVGEEIGAWEMREDGPGAIVGEDDLPKGEDVELLLLNPTPALTKNRAAELNATEVSSKHHVAVGVGTLGSQVIANLVRTGYGTWTLVDKDVLLPHNVPRHYLGSDYVGFSKARSMAFFANSLFESPVAQPVVEDVLSRDKKEKMVESFRQADSILDMSASVSVARHLALDLDDDAPRTSLFLSPDGHDLVLLAEPSDRSLRIDQLEMEYYWSLIERESLADHLLMEGARLRYGQSCRDVSSELPQELAALYAATGARAYRSLDATPTVRIWRANESMGVSSFELDVGRHKEFGVGNWTLSVSARVIEEMNNQRSKRLPVETGGVLIGAFDTQRCRIYVVGYVPAPPDSEEWPTAYKRGMEGLSERLGEIDTRTAGQLGYVGEWHSHPPNSDTEASEDDKTLFRWLSRHRRKDGLPAVMAVQGENDRSRWFIGSLAQNKEIVTPDI